MKALGTWWPRRWLRYLRLHPGQTVAGLLVLTTGCAEATNAQLLQAPEEPIVRAAAPAAVPESIAAPKTQVLPEAQTAQTTRQVPISLATVLQLAEEQNHRVGQARARVMEATAEKALASKRWIPDISFGTTWYRHEGAIQNEDGTVINSSTGALFSGLEMIGRYDIRDIAYQQISAERKAWQQKGELSRITYETTLDAANTYIDLVTARTGEAIARKLEKDLKDLLERAQKLANVEEAAKVEVHRIEAEIEGRQQNILKLQEQAQAASAKLVYLLGMDPCVELMPVDGELVPLDLIDATPPACALVQLALSQGPGIRELEGMLAVIDKGIQQSQGIGKYLPIFEFRSAEGGFGGGPGASTTWGNRWEGVFCARWNLTELCSCHERKRIASAQVLQARLAYQDLQAKLAAGVQEARGAVLSTKEQIRLGASQVKHADSARNLSRERLTRSVPGSSYSEVLLSQQSLAMAQLNHLLAIREFNKGQIRLMLLIGNGGPAAAPTPVKLAPPADMLPPPSESMPVPHSELEHGPTHLPPISSVSVPN